MFMLCHQPVNFFSFAFYYFFIFFYVISYLLSALHQIIHISRHLLEAGIGLRQICDLAMFLDKHHDVIDKERLNGYLEELQLMTIARSLGYIMVKYLGLKEEKIAF